MDELPLLPAQLPQAQPPELPQGMISKIDGFLQNPIFAYACKSHVEDIQQFIKENSGDFEPLVYDYINSKYPNIYATIKPEESLPEGDGLPEDQEEPLIKPTPQSEINFQIWQMHLEGYSATEIADYLSDKFDRDIYAMHVGRQISRMKALAEKAAPKIPDEPAIKPTSTQATRTPKPIDQDTHLVMTSLASVINFWTNIKFYVYMSLAGLAGAIIQKTMLR